MAEIAEIDDKFENAKVYKIHCNITQNVYAGSTDLPKRLGFHESAYKAYKKGERGYVSSFEVLKGDDYQIILLEQFPCESRQQLLIREGLYVKAIPCVNKHRPGRTKAVYCQDNKVKIIKRCIEYNKKHKAQIAKGQKERNFKKNFRLDNPNLIRWLKCSINRKYLKI